MDSFLIVSERDPTGVAPRLYVLHKQFICLWGIFLFSGGIRLRKPNIIRQRLKAEEKNKLRNIEDIAKSYKAVLEFPSPSGSRTKIVAFNLYAEIMTSIDGTFFKKGQMKKKVNNPHEFIKASLAIDDALYPDLPFIGGSIGFAGYSYSFLFEEIDSPEMNPVGIPDFHFLYHTDYFIYSGDDFSECSHLHLDYEGERSEEELAKNMKYFREKLSTYSQASGNEMYLIHGIKSNTNKEKFIDTVNELKARIRNGDIFQAVLSQRWTGSFRGDPEDYYGKLKQEHPDTFHFHINFGSYHIVGCSPERLIAIDQGVIHSNPIAGTRRRGSTIQEDEEQIASLIADEKEKAEHVMLVDLARNDLGKICKPESVNIKRFMEIELFKNVIHLVSEITGLLNEAIHPMDAIKACLPAGTVSGAPKIRAMQLISEAEQERRGAYGGGVGFISYGGELDLALAIRMMVIKDQQIHFQAGAGIVYDSIPENEWYETLHKVGFKEDGINDFTYR